MKNIFTSGEQTTFHFAVTSVADLNVVAENKVSYREFWRVHPMFFGQFANIQTIGRDGMRHANFRRKRNE